MALVAHVQRLREHEAQVNAFFAIGHGFGEQGAEYIAHPVQAVDHALVVRTHAQDFRELLGEVGKRHVAVGFVFYHVHVHRRAGHACHRADALMLVAGRESDFAACRHFRGLVEIFCPALEDDGPSNRAAHRAVHVFPRNRRAGVQQHFVGHAGDDVACARVSGEYRLRAGDACERFHVGGVDFFGDVGALQFGKRGHHLRIALRWRLPLKLGNRYALRAQVVSKTGNTEVDHVQCLLEQLHDYSPLTTNSRASRPASVELGAMVMPAFLSMATWLATSGVSSSVPST